MNGGLRTAGAAAVQGRRPGDSRLGADQSWQVVTIGAYDAKTHLSRLLDDVAAGKTVVITKHGRPVAKLVPIEPTTEHPAETVAALRSARRGVRHGGSSTRQLAEVGRR